MHDRERDADQLCRNEVGLDNRVQARIETRREPEAVNLLDIESNFDTVPKRVRHFVETLFGDREEFAEDRRAERRIRRGKGAALFKLDPYMITGLGQKRRIVHRIRRNIAVGKFPHDPADSWEHALDKFRGERIGQLTARISSPDSSSAQQSNQQVCLIESIAGRAPQRASGAAQRAAIDLKADFIAHKLENLGGIVAQLRCLGHD
ncbi:MAG: hypothetical protein QNJ67_18215 [Kiloniellales bacterium]|nr:hypothetical protein [Kiloniellales bacterium]